MSGHMKWVRSAALIAGGLWVCGVGVAAQSAAPTAEQIKVLEEQQKQAEIKVSELAKQVYQARIAAYKASKMASPLANTSQQFNIPKLAKAPVIDGVTGDGEWTGTTAIPINGYGVIWERPVSVFYYGFDAENLYVAQKYFLLPNEKPIQADQLS